MESFKQLYPEFQEQYKELKADPEVTEQTFYIIPDEKLKTILKKFCYKDQLLFLSRYNYEKAMLMNNSAEILSLDDDCNLIQQTEVPNESLHDEVREPPKKKKRKIQKEKILVTSKTKKVVLDCLTDPDRSKYDSIDVQNKWRDRYKKRMEDFMKRDGKTYITTPAEYFKTFPCLKDNTAIPMLQSDFNNILLSLAQRKNPVISENDIESYRTLFQEQWPLLSPKVVE
ncbi:hypothetical protein TKK_0019138 [Trichogramma kaykai]